MLQHSGVRPLISVTQIMNKYLIVFITAVVIGAQPLPAQNSSPDPVAGAEMTGTIKEYTAGASLVLDTLPPTPPVQFKLGQNISYSDPDGKTIDVPGLTLNQRVRVHYRKVGGDNVVDKVALIRD
jgi:hypothetical protein